MSMRELQQALIDVLGFALLVIGLPLLLWYLATQDIGPAIEFFTVH